MNNFNKDLSSEQKCAMVALAFDLCRSNAPSKEALAKVEPILNDFCEELNLLQSEAQSFINKMMSSGGINDAIQILNTIGNKRILGSMYPNLYNFVATIDSPEGLEQLNMLYNDEFDYNEEEIKTLWDLYEIKDFRRTLPANPTESELLELVSNNKSFITLRKYFNEWIEQGTIEDRIFIVKTGYIGLVSFPNIFLTESRATKELDAAKDCYEIWLKYDTEGINKSINSDNSEKVIVSSISILPPEKIILLKCQEFFTLHYLLKGLYNSFSDEELAKINGDDYAKVWLNIFEKGYHFGDNDKEYEVDRNHFYGALRIISKMKLSSELQEQTKIEKIKDKFDQYYHIENNSYGKGCMAFITMIITASLVIACSL